MNEWITSRKNPLLQQVKKLLSSKKAREEAGLFAADGTKLLEEAVKYFSLCVAYDPSMRHRANLDPEMHEMLKRTKPFSQIHQNIINRLMLLKI